MRGYRDWQELPPFQVKPSSQLCAIVTETGLKVSFKMIKRVVLILCVFITAMPFTLREELLLFAQSKTYAHPQKPLAQVPFVGCASDGQVGPVKAPTGQSKLVPISAETASRLAYYKSEYGFGVLAPRGWSCFGVYGSYGSALYVSPEHITASNLFSSTWGGFTGPAIELAGETGDTSGRFGVARVIARVFHARRQFVEDVIEEGIELASSFPLGPYPGDKLVYRNDQTVEYETPANTDGLGTNSRLKKSAYPISGVAILTGETPDLMFLAVRLPPDLTDLTSPVIQQPERDVEHSKSSAQQSAEPD
jgi:hypothetical protein